MRKGVVVKNQGKDHILQNKHTLTLAALTTEASTVELLK